MQQFGFQSSGTAATQLTGAEPPTTLLIHHLPEAITHDTLSRLFSHYGALSVRSCTSGRLKNCVFVDFNNELLASQVQHHLNGSRFLGKILSVERASMPIADNKNKLSETQQQDEPISPKTLPRAVCKNNTARFECEAITVQEPIAERLGIDYAFPPHLEYLYPLPDGNILNNIVNALIAVPRFYTQVLHLMNKMNLPAPFGMALPTPPLPSSALNPSPPVPPVQTVEAYLSSDESELDSSGEDLNKKNLSSGTLGLAKIGQKRTRLESIDDSGVDKDVAHEAVVVKSATLTPKEIPTIKKKNSLLQIKIGHKETLSVHSDENIIKYSEDAVKESMDSTPFATAEELKDGRLPPEEILSLPMFKNYTTGNPASVLYIKNLAKSVLADDFYYIFGSFFGSIDEARSGLCVKLMQEGRMRGQAFVTFPSIELASSALNMVNGYVFKGKAMIVQFGRNVPKPT